MAESARACSAVAWWKAVLMVSSLASAPLEGQVISGVLLDATTAEPLRQLPVWLMHLGTMPNKTVASVNADAAGRFTFGRLAPGPYQLVFGALAGPHSTRLAPDTVRGDTTVVHQVRIAVRTWQGRDVFQPFEATRPVTSSPMSGGPRFPVRRQNDPGLVLMVAIVDTLGEVERGSARVLWTSDEAYGRAVLTADRSLRYAPSVFGAVPVRQMICQPFEFAIEGITLREPMKIPRAAVPDSLLDTCITPLTRQAFY